MAIYVYRTSDGSLYSWAPNDTDPVADAATLAASGLAVVSGLPVLDSSHAWDAVTKTVVSVTPPPVPKPITTGKWIMRFTPQEFQAINTSADPQVQQLMYALNHTTDIDLSDPLITNGTAYLVAINLLQSSRVAAIMAGAA
jgi:hypothetical protein